MSQKRSLFLTDSTTAEMEGVGEVTKKPKKGPGLKIVCSAPVPAPTPPSNLDKSTTISINGKKLNIAADDLQFVCTLGEFEEVIYVGLHVDFRVRRVLHGTNKTSKRLLMFLCYHHMIYHLIKYLFKGKTRMCGDLGKLHHWKKVTSSCVLLLYFTFATHLQYFSIANFGGLKIIQMAAQFFFTPNV